MNLNDTQSIVLTEIVCSVLDKAECLDLRDNKNKLRLLRQMAETFAMVSRFDGLELSLINRLSELVINLFDMTDLHEEGLNIMDVEYLHTIYEECLGYSTSFETMEDIMRVITK